MDFRRLRHVWLAVLLLLSSLLAACTGLPTTRPEPDQFTVAAHAEGRWLRNKDNLTLFGQWWLPDNEPKAVVLLVHGTALHSGFYAPWAETLTQQGYGVFGIDLRGWGQSQGFGRHGYVRSYDEYLDDLALAAQEIHRRYPDTPLFLQGESMGGTIVLLASITGRIASEGLILNAPAVQPSPGFGWVRPPNFLASFGLWVLGSMGKLAPNFPAVPLFESLSTRSTFFDPAARERFLNDPHNTHTALPAAYLTGIDEGTRRLRDNLGNLREPFIVLHGSKDSLVPLSSSEFLLETAHSADKTLKRYEGMSHTTLHDSGKEKVWADIVVWLDARTQKMTVMAEDVPLVGAR